jgi:EmrB/QacA subfamily drug resistance transporter
MLRDVRVPLTQLDHASWIVSGYLLGYVCVLPLMGRLSDVYGRRPVYLAALALFALASVACATAQDLWWLVAARVCQAMGGGALLPVTFAMVSDGTPAARRTFWLGAIGAAAEAGGVLGPLYGAAIVQHLGWRWIFWINLPLALAIAAAITRSPSGRRQAGGPAAIDYPGAILLAAALAALTIGLSGSGDPTTSVSPIQLERAIPLTIVAVAALAAFVWRERRAASPLLPLGLFRDRPFAMASAANGLVGVTLIAALVDVPLFSAAVLGRSPLDAGLALLRLTVCIPVGALAGGWLAGRLPAGAVAVAGLALTSLGFLLMSRWTADVSELAMTPGLVLAGLGFGLVIAPLTEAVLSAAGARDRALAIALLTVMRMAGMTVGLAGLTSLAFYRFNQLAGRLAASLPAAATPEGLAQRLAAYQAGLAQAALEVFTGVFLIAAAICLANCLFGALIGPSRPAPQPSGSV